MCRSVAVLVLAFLAMLSLAQGNALQKAMQQEDLTDLRKILDNGYDLTKLDSEGLSPLHRICGTLWQGNAPEIVRILLAHGAPVDLRDKNGRTPLMIAAQCFNPEVTQALLDGHADFKVADKQGYRAIHHCVLWTQYDFIISGREERCAETIRTLVKGGESVDARATDGSTPLIVACSHWHLPSVKALIALGADVNAENQRGFRPLSSPAYWIPKSEYVTVLMKAGARPNCFEYTALGQTQAALDSMPVNDVDRPCGPGDSTILMIAAKRGDAKVVEELLRRGADPNIRSDSQSTALHYATGTQPLEGQIGITWQKPANGKAAALIVRLLVDKGANLEARDRVNRTPLLWASNAGSWEAALELLKSGANPSPTIESYENSPLEAAVEANQPAIALEILKRVDPKKEGGAFDRTIWMYPRTKLILEAFLKAGFSVNAPYEEEGSPLITAAQTSLVTVQALIAQKANVEMPDRNGHTPIMSAKNWEIFQFLQSKGADPLHVAPDGYSALFTRDSMILRYMLEHRADPNRPLTQKGRYGSTPLMDAAYYRDIERARLLLDHGANPDLKDGGGNSAMAYALGSGDKKIVALFKSYQKKTGK